MKKALALLLSLAMVMGMAACGNQKESTPATTEPVSTAAPTTVAPSTEAPTTEAPTTEAPTTEAPTTEAPTTEAPTTEAPTTEAPTTETPTTEAPTTEAPTTEAPTTEAPTATEPTQYYTLGDVNMDGKINSADARLALRAAAKVETLSELQDLSEEGAANLNKLHDELGIALMMGNFGSKHTNVPLLYMVHFDGLELTKDFAPQIPANEDACKIVIGIQHMAVTMDMNVCVKPLNELEDYIKMYALRKGHK